MRILVVSGNPKKDGLTWSFEEVANETMSELGVDADIVRLSEINLTKCKMCGDGWGICFNKHTCIFGDKDGFNELLKKVEKADAFIYISPVYWGEISEEFKIYMDKLRRTQATKQWNSDENEVSFMIGKPSIMVAVAGGGGGGIISTFENLERAILHMGGDAWPRESSGIFDYIGVNRWNQEYKREAFKMAIKTMYDYWKRPNITSITPQPDYKLLIKCDDGKEITYDMKPYLETEPYTQLKDENLFNEVKIAGMKIEWRPRLDLDIRVVFEGK